MTWYLPETVWVDGRLASGLAMQAAAPVAVVQSQSTSSSADVVRLPGSVLPGLTDAHVHTALIDLPMLRAGGIAAVWDLGGPPNHLAGQARKNTMAVRYAGPFMIAPGGYPSDRSWVPPGSCREIHSPLDASAAVEEAHAFGASFIKVTAHADGPMLPPHTLAAVVDAAHARELPVVVHAEGPGTVAAAYDSGADLLAHTPWTENVDDGLVRACADRMTWISTLDIHGWGTPTAARTIAIGNLRRFWSYGGKVRYGTDLGNGPLPVAVNAREVRALGEAGMQPSDILTAMTENDGTTGLTWIPSGLDLNPEMFAQSIATARVLGPEAHPSPEA